MDDQLTGLTLRRAREMAGMDERTAAKALGLRRRELRSIERGRTEASHDLLNRAVHAYGGDELRLPARADLIHQADPSVLVVGAERISVDLARHDDRTLLSQYLVAVRRQRGLGPKDPVSFRSTDIVALAGVLDLASDELERQLCVLAGMTGATARRTAQMLVLTGLCVLAVGGATWAKAADGPGQATPARATPIGAEVAGLVDTHDPFVVERHLPGSPGGTVTLRGHGDGDGDADDAGSAGSEGSEAGSPFSTNARLMSTIPGSSLPLFLPDGSQDGTHESGAVGIPGTEDGGDVEDSPAVSDENDQREAAQKKADEEAAQKKADEEAAQKKRDDEESARKKADEEAAKKRDEEQRAQRKKDDEAALQKKADEEAARKKKADQEESAKREAEQRKADEEAAQKKADEEAAKKRDEEQTAQRKKDDEEAARKKADQEESAKREAEQKKADEEAAQKKKADQEESAKREAEQKKRDEEAAQKKRDEDESAKKKDEDPKKRD